MDVKPECVEWLKASGHQSSLQLHLFCWENFWKDTLFLHYGSATGKLFFCLDILSGFTLLSTWGSNAKSSVNQGKASFCPQDEVQKSFLKLSGFWTILLLVATLFFPLSISPTSLSSRSQVGCTSLQPQSFPLLFPEPEMSSPYLTTPRFPSNLNLVPLPQVDLSRHALLHSIHPCNMLL